MIEITEFTNQYGLKIKKLNNVPSAAEGWKYIHDYTIKHCRDYGYNSYSIGEHYEEIGIASLLFFDDVYKEPFDVISFDISKFADKENPLYPEFAFFDYKLDLSEVYKKEPNLTAVGIEEQGEYASKDLPDPAEVQRCLRWLKGKRLIPTQTASFNSISIKQLVERECSTYVSGGAAIAAIIHLGIPYRKIKGSHTVKVYLSRKEILGRPKRFDRYGQEIKSKTTKQTPGCEHL